MKIHKWRLKMTPKLRPYLQWLQQSIVKDKGIRHCWRNFCLAAAKTALVVMAEWLRVIGKETFRRRKLQHNYSNRPGRGAIKGQYSTYFTTYNSSSEQNKIKNRTQRLQNDQNYIFWCPENCQIWFHVKYEWQKNLEISTLWFNRKSRLKMDKKIYRFFNFVKGVRFLLGKPNLWFRPSVLTNRRHLKMWISAPHSHKRSWEIE